jgi:hypothetical protein
VTALARAHLAEVPLGAALTKSPFTSSYALLSDENATRDDFHELIANVFKESIPDLDALGIRQEGPAKGPANPGDRVSGRSAGGSRLLITRVFCQAPISDPARPRSRRVPVWG